MRPAWETQIAWNMEAEQAGTAQVYLRTCCMILGLQTTVDVIEVKDNDRFVLAYEQDPTKPDFAKNMIKLETLMRQTMGVVIDLRLESKEDKNRRAGRNGRE